MRPDGPYALCWFARQWGGIVRARIAPLLVADAVELAQRERERWPDRVFWIEAWPEEPPRWSERRRGEIFYPSHDQPGWVL